MPGLLTSTDSTMKGIVISKTGEDFQLVENLVVPKPARRQILVKSLVVGLNAFDQSPHNTNITCPSNPTVLGSDASGVVVEVGVGVQRFKIGDHVSGCTRFDSWGYGTWGEFFLMDEVLAFKKPENVSCEQAATLGAGLLTASLGLISGACIELESTNGRVGEEWFVVLGAAGCVGQYAVQIAKMCGFKVLGSCSPENDEFLRSRGADATFNYKLPLAEQLKEIASITGGKFSRVFDASAKATQTGMEALASHGDSKAGVKYFATSNDWDKIERNHGIQVNIVSLSKIGKTGNESVLHLNQDIEDFIPILEEYFADGDLKPMEYEVVGGVGVGSVLKGLEAFKSRESATKKIVVRIAAK